MITSGKYLEAIIEKLTILRAEIQVSSTMGLFNINKHSENFLKTLLNLTYGYELENLNQGVSNYPGLDIGDKSEGIAYQITSTKKSDKVDNTLATCLKYEHYKLFPKINVFVLTTKQDTYTLKTVTKPFFEFTAENNVLDFGDLIKDIEHVGPVTMKGIYDFISMELQPTINSIKTDKRGNKEPLLDVNAAMAKTKMTTYDLWQSSVTTKNQKISVPEIYSKLNNFLSTADLNNRFLPILNRAFLKTQSNNQILYLNEVASTGISNMLYGYGMMIEASTITVEKVNYTNDSILLNLQNEMLMLLTQVLFLSKQTNGKIELEVTISLRANTEVYFSPNNSLVIQYVPNTFKLDGPLQINELLTDIETSTLANLLQKIIHGFIAHESNLLSHEPFISIDRNATDFVINNIKNILNVDNGPSVF